MDIWGSVWGNIAGTLYFLYFQFIGIYLSYYLIKKCSFFVRLLLGSVLGSVLLQWLPVLCAFLFNFSIAAHLLAAGVSGLIAVLLYYLKIPHEAFSLPSLAELKLLSKNNIVFVLLFIFTFLLFTGLNLSHTLLLKSDGFHTGQSTYGDMNMHLSFITSIARQQTFPPGYSISPGDKLCYPFLSDSISSSIYLFGSSLRYAYLLPMYFAFLQVMGGFYCLAGSILKKSNKACLSFFLFFYNGGLGFLYFIDWSSEKTYQLTNIFTEFYQTPTNLIQNNIRWVNIIADMLLPQRATLFGYAILFPCIYLIYRAVFNSEKQLFYFAAILTGALPMIHTHSFLGIAIISSGLLFMHLFNGLYSHKKWCYPGKWLLLFFVIFMCLLQFTLKNNPAIGASFLMGLCITVLSILFITGLSFLFRYIKRFGYKELAGSFGIFLLLVMILALPQLIFWTFGQASGDGFIQGHFNWGNQGDPYLWFYIKNWGIILLLLIPAVMNSRRKNFTILIGGFLIFFIAELITFTPNTYDNNKLLYIAYALFCCISADFGCDVYDRLKRVQGKKILVFCFLFLAGISAFLTLGREWVSDYTMYSTAQIEAAAYIEKNTPPNTTVLTSSRHVNEIASLSGCNIVNGADVFLWPHGLYNEQRVSDVKMMYENPADSYELFKKYQVKYITVSSWERSDYVINDAVFDHLFHCVFSMDDFKIYKLEQN